MDHRTIGGEGRKNRQSGVDLMKIRLYMEQHYHEPLSIERLAQLANISPKYFVDLFKKTYGHSAIDYLTDLRINRAKRYLVETEYRVREIAQKVGYSDEFYFSRKFKKEVGVSPSAFIRNPKVSVAACSRSVMGQLLALNIIPMAAPLDPKWTPYYYYEYHQHIKVHLEFRDDQSNGKWDKLVKSQPDVIVGTYSLSPEIQKRLNDTASALFLRDELMNWKEQLSIIAGFLGREEECELWIEAYKEKVQETLKLMPQTVRTDTISVLRVNGDGLYLYCNRGIQEVLFQDLQLSPAYCEESMYNRELTLEELEKLDPNRILVLICPEASSRMYWLSLQREEEWRSLKAVSQGQVYIIPPDPWCEYSAVSVSRLLEEMQLLFKY